MTQVDSTRNSDTNKARVQECYEDLEEIFARRLIRQFSGDLILKAHVKQGTIISCTLTEERRK